MFPLSFVLVLLTALRANTQLLKVPASCTGFTCDNGGTMDTSGDECTCTCPDTHTGPQCDTEIETSKWPDGTYATPMPIYGCPESKGSGWRTGYVNMTFSEKLTNDSDLVWKAKRLTLLGPYDDHVVQMNFCYKMSTVNASYRSPVQWPPGSYGIYRSGGKCPDHFEEQRIRFVLPRILRLNTDGHIADLLVTKLPSTTILEIDVCDKAKSSENMTGEFFTDFPFMVLQGSRQSELNENCSSFSGTSSRQETLELMSSNMTRYTNNATAATPEIGLRVCLYKQDLKRPDENLETFGYIRRTYDANLAAIRTAHTSSAYEALYREYPVTRDSDVRKTFFEEAGTYHFNAAKTPLSVFLTSREIPWVLIDLEQMILVERILLTVQHFSDERDIWTYRESPVTAVSNERWAFLTNGAMSCNGNLKSLRHWWFGFMHQCHRPINGRYVSVLGQDYVSSPVKTASFFMRMAQFEVFGTGPGCGKDLGLRDSTIEDFQISSSSSISEHPPGQVRPHLSGWCAMLSDLEPYLQVDLLVATTVEGLKLYNWETAIDIQINNVYGVRTFPVGTSSFWLEYGFSVDNLRVYGISNNKTIFWMDPALQYQHEQTVFLQTPVVASLVRVRPIGFQALNTSATCMKLELVGCRKFKLKSLHCSKKNDTFWSRRTDVFVSTESYHEPERIVGTDPSLCIESCRDCDAIVYNATSQTCLTYHTSQPGPSRVMTRTDDTIIYQKTCLDDPIVVRPYTISFMLRNFVMEHFPQVFSTNVYKEGVITSLGYPLPYDTGVITKWLVSGVHMVHPEIIFTNISLNEYKTDSDWYTDRLCEDTIVVISHKFQVPRGWFDVHSWDTENLYEDTSSLARINRTMNGRVVSYLASSTAEVWFHACLRETVLSFRGIGFRAIIKQAGRRILQSSSKTYECQSEAPFLIQHASISSISMSGLSDNRHRFEYWKLCMWYQTIELTVSYLDVRCDDNSALEISDNHVPTRKFCNLNRPMKSVTSSGSTLWIRFYYDKLSGRKGIQGFHGAVVKTKYMEGLDFTFIETQARNIFIDGILTGAVTEKTKVCVPVLRRCYGMYRNIYLYHMYNQSSDFLTARTANEKCVENMGPTARLVSIRSELEAEFIVEHIAPGFNNGFVGRNFAIGDKITLFDFCYIGLVLDTDIHGSLKARWRNGSPNIYSGWSSDQPKDVATKRCVRMGVYSKYLLNTWETIDCDTLAAEFYVCETDMNSTDVAPDHIHQGVFNTSGFTDQLSSNRYFQCGSEELISRLFVCDGLKDCLDGTDEVNCECTEKEKQCGKPPSLKCRDGDRIPISMACDYVTDCLDGSDEDCEFPQCSINEFRCNNHQCIPSSFVCNYRRDCLDSSDEIQCDTCQNGTFQCGDRSCIPEGRVCDGVADCPRQQDEQNCEITSMPSCAHWWRVGPRETGVFLVNNTRVLCNFDNMTSQGIIQTKYYNIQVEKTPIGQFEITYENQTFVSALMERFNCNQSLIQTCEPPADRIDEMEEEFGLTGNRPCVCIRLLWTPNASYAEPCTTGNRTSLTEQWLQEKGSMLSQYRDRPLTRVEPVTASVENQWMKIEPIVCEEHVPAEDWKLICDSGQAVGEATRCLYDVTELGEVVGCRDLSHLQHCENFTCPDGFAKCENSYCVSVSLLCDGEWQCPGGQDERFCWCGKHGHPVTIVYDADAELQHAALRLATQLYEHSDSMVSSNVELVRYWGSAKGQAEKGDFGYLVSTEIEYTPFNPRKINQFSEKKRSTLLQTATLIPSTLALTGQTPSALAIFENDMSRSHLPIDELMSFDHSMLGQIQTYIVSIGRESELTDDVYRDAFPANTSFVNFKTDDTVVPFPLSSTVCPDMLPDLSPVCPGMYRCHATRQCIAITGVCNGFRQCPLGDDEKLCDFSCPVNCACSGYEVDCSLNRTSVTTLSNLSVKTRYLDLHSNDFQTFEFNASRLPFMVTLNMSHCLIVSIPALFLESMRNLLHLDLSFNRIKTLRAVDFKHNFRLVSLDLAENTALTVLEVMSFRDLIGLRRLNIRHSNIHTLAAQTFYNLNVSQLDLSENRISIIENRAFDGATIDSLDITKNPIVTFQSGMFEGISNLQTLRSDAYKFCCIRPDSVKEEECYPPRDEFSSCEDLMRNEVLRFLIWIIGICALLGNIFSLLYRFKFDRKRLKLGYGVFVTNLAVSDLLMGLYLLMIAATDVIYRGRYIEVDDWWRNSAWCGLAGILATMSSEGSVLFMCLITLDRFIVVKYPFGDVRFSTKNALLAAGICWAVVATIATIPLLLTSYFDDQFYSRSAVCLALPLTRKRPPGWAYSSTVFIGFNFVVFLLIAGGQFLIYKEVRASSTRITKTKSGRSSDLVVARNLMFIVATDFLCWFPIGVMGMMALSDYTVSGEVYAWAAVLILPVNSALNPFLYTFSAMVGSKKSASRTEDKQNTNIFPKDIVDSVLALWEKKLLCQRSGVRRRHSPLPVYLSERSLTPMEILRVGTRLGQAVHQLHATDLVLGRLSPEYVLIRRHSNKVHDAVLKISPSIASRSTEKRIDIEEVGQTISTLLGRLGETI